MRLARVERLRILLEGKPSANKEEFELCLQDFEDYKFKVGDQFELYYKKSDTTSQIVVEEVLDEIIHVKLVNFTQNENQYQNNNSQWVGCDSDKIQQLGTYKNQTKV